MRLRRVSASTAVRTGSALVQGVQSLLVLTLLPWFGDDNNTDDNHNHDNNNNDAAPDQEKEEGSLLLLAAPIIIAVLALGAVCPGLHFACRAEGWRHLLLQWLECVVAYPLALLALAIALGLRRLPRDARTYEALMGLAWCALARLSLFLSLSHQLTRSIRNRVPPVLGLAADSMLRAALSRVERDGLLSRARMWVAPFGASCLGSLLCFGGLYARAWPSTPRLQCLFWSQALLCAAFGAVCAPSPPFALFIHFIIVLMIYITTATATTTRCTGTRWCAGRA
jgi:hypothetical protein